MVQPGQVVLPSPADGQLQNAKPATAKPSTPAQSQTTPQGNGSVTVVPLAPQPSPQAGKPQTGTNATPAQASPNGGLQAPSNGVLPPALDGLKAQDVAAPQSTAAGQPAPALPNPGQVTAPNQSTPPSVGPNPSSGPGQVVAPANSPLAPAVVPPIGAGPNPVTNTVPPVGLNPQPDAAVQALNIYALDEGADEDSNSVDTSARDTGQSQTETTSNTTSSASYYDQTAEENAFNFADNNSGGDAAAAGVSSINNALRGGSGGGSSGSDHVSQAINDGVSAAASQSALPKDELDGLSIATKASLTNNKDIGSAITPAESLAMGGNSTPGSDDLDPTAQFAPRLPGTPGSRDGGNIAAGMAVAIAAAALAAGMSKEIADLLAAQTEKDKAFPKLYSQGRGPTSPVAPSQKFGEARASDFIKYDEDGNIVNVPNPRSGNPGVPGGKSTNVSPQGLAAALPSAQPNNFYSLELNPQNIPLLAAAGVSLSFDGRNFLPGSTWSSGHVSMYPTESGKVTLEEFNRSLGTLPWKPDPWKPGNR